MSSSGVPGKQNVPINKALLVTPTNVVAPVGIPVGPVSIPPWRFVPVGTPVAPPVGIPVGPVSIPPWHYAYVAATH